MATPHEKRLAPPRGSIAEEEPGGIFQVLVRLWHFLGPPICVCFLAGAAFKTASYFAQLAAPDHPLLHIALHSMASILIGGAAIVSVIRLANSGIMIRLISISACLYAISKFLEFGLAVEAFGISDSSLSVLYRSFFTLSMLVLILMFVVALVDTHRIQTALAEKNRRLEDEIEDRTRIEEALRASEKRFVDMGYLAGEILWESDTQGRFTYVTDRVYDILKRSTEELLGHTPFDFMPPEEAKRAQEWFAGIVQHQKGFKNFEACYLLPDGERTWLAGNGGPVFDENGEFAGYRGTTIDVTEQKRSVDLLRESEERFRAVFDASNDYIQIWDRGHRYLGVNAATMRYFLTEFDSVQGKRVEEVLAGSPDVAEKWGQWIDQVFETGNSLRIEGKTTTIRGVDFYGEHDFMPLRREDGAIFAVGSIYRDITSRRQAENRLRESQELLEKVIESIPIGIWVGDLDFRIQLWNIGQEIMTGISREEVLGRNIFECFPSLNEWGLEEKYRHVVATGEPLVLDDFRFDDGTLRKKNYYLNIRANALFDADGKPTGIVLAVEDITERRRAEVELQRRDAILRSVSFAAEQFLKEGNWDSQIQAVLGYMGEATGVSRLYLFEGHQGPEDELLYSQRFEWVAEGVKPEIDNPNLQNLTEDDPVLRWWRTIFDQGEVVAGYVQGFPEEGRFVLEEQGILSMAVVPIFVDSIFWGFLGFDQCEYEHDWSPAEIDALKAAASVLGTAIQREYAEADRMRLATAIEQAAEAIVVTNAQGLIQYVNPAFEERTGYHRDEVVGRTPRFLRSGKHDDAFYEELRRTLSHGAIWKGRFTNRRKDGTLFEEEATISPISDETGEVQNYVALKRDITAEMNLERQLRQAQKLEAIGTLAGGIAHDFNNVLSLILGHGEILEQLLPEEHPGNLNIEKIIKAGNRGAAMVKQILTFSKQVELEQKTIAIGPAIADALELIRVSLPATIEVRHQVDEECGIVMADATQIHQVVMNLCANAYQAMGRRIGVLEITLERVDIEAPKLGDVGRVEPGTYACLTVKDKGHGMDQHTMQRIFDPFYTTKTPSEGTGLGLSTVHGIVSSSNGAILVRSVLHEGTQFEIYLPLVEDLDEYHPAVEEPAINGAESILFVDDDEEIVQMTGQMLRQLGYKPALFTSGAEAIEAFQERPDAYAVVITDLIMPECTGMDVAQDIMAYRPNMPVILISGFAEGVNPRQVKELGVAAYLTKPISSKKLGTAIRSVLDNPTAIL